MLFFFYVLLLSFKKGKSQNDPFQKESFGREIVLRIFKFGLEMVQNGRKKYIYGFFANQKLAIALLALCILDFLNPLNKHLS